MLYSLQEQMYVCDIKDFGNCLLKTSTYKGWLWDMGLFSGATLGILMTVRSALSG